MTCTSIVGTYWSDEKAKYFGYFEAAIGLGLIIGPPVGSLMYGFFDYQWAFYAFSIFLTFNAILCVFLIPNSLNYN